MNKLIALLPMKDHSERVPNKNIRTFFDEPLFFKIVSSLEKSKYIDSIIINTDSERIASLAMDNFKSVVIHKRPENLCGDFVSTNDLINYDLSKLVDRFFIQTHSTNPLLKTNTIDTAIEKFFDISNKGFDSIFSVTKIQNRFFNENHIPINHDPHKLIRTQDLPPLFEENSNFYIFSRECFLQNKNRIGTNPFLFEMNKLESIDIDTEEDFILAEAAYEKLKKIKDNP